MKKTHKYLAIFSSLTALSAIGALIVAIDDNRQKFIYSSATQIVVSLLVLVGIYLITKKPDDKASKYFYRVALSLYITFIALYFFYFPSL